jgi:hypothetical protein
MVLLGLADRVSGMAARWRWRWRSQHRWAHSGRLDHHELPGKRLKAQN